MSWTSPNLKKGDLYLNKQKYRGIQNIFIDWYCFQNTPEYKRHYYFQDVIIPQINSLYNEDFNSNIYLKKKMFY